MTVYCGIDGNNDAHTLFGSNTHVPTDRLVQYGHVRTHRSVQYTHVQTHRLIQYSHVRTDRLVQYGHVRRHRLVNTLIFEDTVIPNPLPSCAFSRRVEFAGEGSAFAGGPRKADSRGQFHGRCRSSQCQQLQTPPQILLLRRSYIHKLKPM